MKLGPAPCPRTYERKVQTLMVINATNTTDNPLSSYLNFPSTKRPRDVTLEIQILAKDRDTNVAELNRMMCSQHPSC